ncbi:type I restriction-modification system subunit M [Cohnella boryungensis]|uniref:site-specific DNA-methyltransferase (adenine-specific) n=1 Tax=Cohnella boryungensis TaxID=768479 RepID=A0ABV8SD57_9BACL
MTKGTGLAGMESKLWMAADKLRGSIAPTRYKDIVLGILFLKYISDREKRDENKRPKSFRVPEEARWTYIMERADTAEIGFTLDEAFRAIERGNKRLSGVLPIRYSGEELDPRRIGEVVAVIDSFDTLTIEEDALGRVYEYFLGKFASLLGQGDGEFYTPDGVVKLLVEMIGPVSGTLYDPCCGSGGMLVQASRAVQAQSGRISNLSVFGQEMNAATRRLAIMNLTVRGVEADLGRTNGDTLRADQFMDRKFDNILANPPFNVSDWGQESLLEDPRWQWGVPAKGNANYAWLSHTLAKLAPSGVAGIVLANGSLTSRISGEGDLRREMIERDKVDCIVSLPDKLFYTTGIPVSLWLFRNGKRRKGEVLFLDARSRGTMVNRKLRELEETDIGEIAGAYHRWLADCKYQDKAGWCKSASIADIRERDYLLTPARYVGVKETEEGEPFGEKMDKLVAELAELMSQTPILDERIKKSLRAIGYEL